MKYPTQYVHARVVSVSNFSAYFEAHTGTYIHTFSTYTQDNIIIIWYKSIAAACARPARMHMHSTVH